MAVSFKRKPFIVISLSEIETFHHTEETLPMLLQIVDSSEPDFRDFSPFGVIAFYLTSRRALRKVEVVTAECERLRNVDTRFAKIGIGLAEGELMAEFSVFGTLKSKPLGVVLDDAVKRTKISQNYRDTLQALRYKINGTPT